MTRSYNGSPQEPRSFLGEIQRSSLEAIQQESLGQSDPTPPGTPPSQPLPLQDQSAAIAAIALFSTRVQREVFDLMCKRDDALRHGKALSQENKQMRLTIDALNETVVARDASIAELTARIEALTREKAKLQTA